MQVIKQCKCNTEFTKTQVDNHIKTPIRLLIYQIMISVILKPRIQKNSLSLQ